MRLNALKPATADLKFVLDNDVEILRNTVHNIASDYFYIALVWKPFRFDNSASTLMAHCGSAVAESVIICGLHVGIKDQVCSNRFDLIDLNWFSKNDHMYVSNNGGIARW